jgi:hypothetical protein
VLNPSHSVVLDMEVEETHTPCTDISRHKVFLKWIKYSWLAQNLFVSAQKKKGDIEKL